MEKVPWDVGRDGVVMGVGWRVRGRERGRRKKMLLGGVGWGLSMAGSLIMADCVCIVRM